MPQYCKENGIVLWTCVRHAQLTQDKAWLESVWPKLERAAAYIKELRQRSLENASPLDDGMNPPGDIDGGLSGGHTHYTRPEYHQRPLEPGGSACVHSRPRDGSARATRPPRWQKEYDDFWRHSARPPRATCRGQQGNSYLPIFMGNAGQELPQRAQWAFCHAVYPGQIFAKDDPLVAGNLAMLEATEREGMVYGTGWDATGIWNYFASFYGHAWLWQGNGRKGRANSLRLRQPRLADLGVARGTVVARGEIPESRRHAAQLGQRRVHPADRSPVGAGSRRRAALVRGLAA